MDNAIKCKCYASRPWHLNHQPVITKQFCLICKKEVKFYKGNLDTTLVPVNKENVDKIVKDEKFGDEETEAFRLKADTVRNFNNRLTRLGDTFLLKFGIPEKNADLNKVIAWIKEMGLYEEMNGDLKLFEDKTIRGLA